MKEKLLKLKQKNFKTEISARQNLRSEKKVQMIGLENLKLKI